MRGMLLAAGLGTRLQPLTDERPKPAVPVGLEPLAVDAIRTFVDARVSRLDVNAHHLPDALERELLPYLPDAIPARVHREARLLGTGGGIRAAVGGASDEPVLVMNGDIRFRPDVAALASRHAESNAAVTLVVRAHPDPFALGAVEVDADGFVVRIAGKPESRVSANAAYVFTGVHLIAPEALRWLPEEGCVVRKAYQPMLGGGVRIATVVDDGPWADLGTIPVYFEANMALARVSEHGRIVDPSAEVHPDATLEGSIIGANASLGPNARLLNCIVWSGARVDEALENAIVTPGRVVHVGPR